ncbi:4-alpha-glucanotransferase, partial [bacterium]|nr:4-alpha-glucanotransferase [bacterium]
TPVATLLPLTSLANFSAALDFLSWLKLTGQQGWQMLPVHDPLDTPYRSQGIGFASRFFDRQLPEKYRLWLISRDEFIAQNENWLLDYALYKALARQFDTPQWWRWPRELATYDPGSVRAWREKLREPINAFIDEQYALTNQFLHLRRAAAEAEQLLLADVPFYLSRASSLVWSHQHLFIFSGVGELKFQSGVPAGRGEPFGAQLWGHPLYNWRGGEIDGIIDLFATRLEFLSHYFSLVRLDHANGFFRYGMMSAEHPSWNKRLVGPGRDALLPLLQTIQRLHLGVYLENIAADTMSLEQTMKDFNLAGTSVATLTYNLEHRQRSQLLSVTDDQLRLENLGGHNIVFSSTHDTPTLLSWVKNLPPEIRARFIQVNHLPDDATDKGLACHIRTRLLALDARLVIIPWQDWQLDTFRFNVPGREELTNWHYPVDIRRYLPES